MYSQGKTLVELLLALVILGIVSSAAVPSFQQLLQQQRLRNASNTLFSGIYSARQAAIHYAQPVSLRNHNGSWASGAEVFLDDNSNGVREANERILLTIQSLKGVVAEGNRHVENYITYRADGSAYLKSGAFQVGTLRLCALGLAQERRLILSIGGRLRREQRETPTACGQ